MTDISGEDAYLFRHALVRDAAYQLQVPSQRARLHGLALAILESLPDVNRRALGLEFARHAELAQDAATGTELESLRKREREYLRLGADHARIYYDYATALTTCERLYQAAESPAAAADVADMLADVLQRMGRWRETRQYFEIVRRDAPNPERRGRAMLHLAWMDLETGNTDSALKTAAEGEEVTDRIGSDRLRIAFVLLRAKHRVQTGDLDEALRLQQQAIELARRTNDEAQEIIACDSACELEVMRGNPDKAESFMRRALRMSNKPHFRHMRVFILLNGSRLALAREQYTEAEQRAQEAFGIADETGSTGFKGSALTAVAVARNHAGRHRDALDALEHLPAIIEETGDAQLEFGWLMALSASARGLGQPELARPHLKGAEQRLKGALQENQMAELKAEQQHYP